MMSKYRIKLTGRLASLQLPLQSRNNVVSEQVEEMVEELLEAVEHKVISFLPLALRSLLTDGYIK